jgi:hypothetical protein
MNVPFLELQRSFNANETHLHLTNISLTYLILDAKGSICKRNIGSVKRVEKNWPSCWRVLRRHCFSRLQQAGGRAAGGRKVRVSGPSMHEGIRFRRRRG